MKLIIAIILLLLVSSPKPKQVTCKVVNVSDKVTTLRCDKSVYDFPREEYEFTGCTEVTFERVDGKTKFAEKQAKGCRVVKQCASVDGYGRRPTNITPCEN